MTTDPKQPEAQEAPASESSDFLDRLRETLPRVGEKESVWCMVRGYDLRAAVNALAALGKQPTQEDALESMFSVDVINCVRVWGLPDDYLEAFMAGKARPSTPLQPTQEADAWKKVVDDELALCESTVSSFPDARAAVRGLIDWHVRNQEAPADAKDAAKAVVIDAYAIPTKVALGAEIKIQRTRQLDGSTLWKVSRSGECLNKSGEWEWEPMPSSRDDEFLARCRFANAQEAIDSALQSHQEGK